MSRRLVVGDIHGCAFTFEQLLLNNCKIRKSDEIYLLGDYVDRGPRSKRVIDFIIKLRQDGFRVHTLKGNHEQMMIDATESQEKFNHWLKNGGKETLRSFDLMRMDILPPKYRDFLNQLDYYYELDDFIIVHGGLNFAIERPLEDLSSMLWIRNDYVDINKTHNKRLIVGHSPVPESTSRASLNTDMIMLDGGCVYSEIRPDLGKLFALNLSNMELHVESNLDY